MKDAKEVIREALGEIRGCWQYDDETDTLHAALLASGHLRTGIEREAVEACERYEAAETWTQREAARDMCACAGRRSLDEKRPKPWRIDMTAFNKALAVGPNDERNLFATAALAAEYVAWKNEQEGRP